MRLGDVTAQVIAEANSGVVVELRWHEPDRPDAMELFQVLRLRDGKVVDMEDFAARRVALKAVASSR